MTDTQEYNGWKNVFTWNVVLWLQNDEPMYRYCSMMLDDLQDDPDVEDVESKMARQLEDYVTELNPIDTGLFSDLITKSLAQVDWYEVARSFIED